MPLLDLFWITAAIFLGGAWLLFTFFVAEDGLGRADLSRTRRVAWIVAAIFVPFVGHSPTSWLADGRRPATCGGARSSWLPLTG